MQRYFPRTIIVSSSIIAASVIFFGAALFWFSRNIAADASKIQEIKSLLQTRARSIELLAELKQTAPEVAKYKQQMDSLLPTQNEQFVDFRHRFDAVSRAHNVTAHYSFESPTVPATDTAAGYNGFTLDASGSYDDIKGFFEEIEITSGRFLISLDSFTVTQGSGGYQVIAHGKAYFR